MIIQSSIPVNVNELFCRRLLNERVVVISWSKNYVFLMCLREKMGGSFV